MLTPQAESVALLTAVLGKRSADGPKPLSIGEWADLGQMLKAKGMQPADLLAGDGERAICDWQHRSISVERVRRLLARGTALALCLERWERSGLWLLVRSDADYPRQLKRRLAWKSPPLLFGCGNRALLAKRGLAIVGSRDATSDDLEVAVALGRAAAGNGHSVVSGGARGVDETAMHASLDVEGTAVGVLAGGLQHAVTSRKWRSALTRGDLALISPYAPDARFHPGHAMARNRYIYCLATAAAVVASEQDSGGTWRGAVENLKHAWVPLWVHPSTAPGTGNAALEAEGAMPLPEDASCLFADKAARFSPPKASSAAPAAQPSELDTKVPDADLDHYRLFLLHLEQWTRQSPISFEELKSREGVLKVQLTSWLNKGQRKGAVDEVDSERYRFVSQPGDDTSPQLALLEHQ